MRTLWGVYRKGGGGVMEKCICGSDGHLRQGNYRGDSVYYVFCSRHLIEKGICQEHKKLHLQKWFDNPKDAIEDWNKAILNWKRKVQEEEEEANGKWFHKLCRWLKWLIGKVVVE